MNNNIIKKKCRVRFVPPGGTVACVSREEAVINWKHLSSSQCSVVDTWYIWKMSWDWSIHNLTVIPIIF